MSGVWLAYALTFAIAFAVSLALSPLSIRLGIKLGVADRPGGRRQHRGVISRLGGIALYGGFVAAVIASQFLSVPRLDPNEPRRLAGLLAGTTTVFILGLLDDWYELGPGLQFAGQLLATLVGMAGLIFIEYVNNPFGGPDARLYFPWWLAGALTIFWMMGMMNTVNWLDGLDGLAAGVVAIASLVLFANAAFRLQPAQESVALLPLALAGACLGFLPFNFHPARVFMGGGAYVLGYALGALSIIGGAKVAAVLLVLGIPIVDAAVTIVRRWRRGGRPDVGDRGHLHFLLYDAGLPQRSIVIAYYVFCAVFGALDLAVSPRLYKLLALAVLTLLVTATLLFAGRHGKRI